MEKYLVPNKLTDLVGDSQRYKTEKGVISLLCPCRVTMNMFEIYCIEGELFEDTERYDTLKEAEERINELLN